LNHIERDLLQAQILVWNATDMLRDARRILLPHLPDTSSEVEKPRAAIAFVTGDVPLGEIWMGTPPFVVPLRIVTRLGGHRLVLDRDHLESVAVRPVVELAEKYPKDKRIFLNQGKTWFVVYDSIPKSVGDSVGMRYICHLLQNQEQEIHVAALRGVEAGEQGAPVLGSAGEILDEQALNEYRGRIAEIDEELTEAERNNDLGRNEALKNELADLYTEVARATGLRGRKREAVDERERARQSVSAAVHRALRAIKKEHNPLWQHLDNSLKIGEYMSYQPDQPTSWIT
jgi:hypothetical protein